MPIGPLEFLILLFCCGGLFFIPVAALVIVLLRRSGKDSVAGSSYEAQAAYGAGQPSQARSFGATGSTPTLDSNDRTLAALGYVIWIVALVVLVLDETKRKPLLKDHAVQALGFAVAGIAFELVAGVFYSVASFISFGLLGLVLWPIFFVPLILGVYYAYLAYTREGLFEIPWLTEFLSQQGWLETRKTY